MELSTLIGHFERHPELRTIGNWIKKPEENLHLKGLSGSSIAIAAASAPKGHKHLFIVYDKEEAAYLYHDLVQIIGEDPVFFLPSTYKRSPEFGQPESNHILLRSEALDQLNKGKNNSFIVSYTEALIEKVPSRKKIDKQSIILHKNEKIDPVFVSDFLTELNFRQCDFVYEPGQYSIRGSIIDVYSFSNENPFRIDFFGDEIESIRTFDIETQLSKTPLDTITILPDLASGHHPGQDDISITGFLDTSTRVWVHSPHRILEKAEQIYQKVLKKNLQQKEVDERDGLPEPDKLISPNLLNTQFASLPQITWGSLSPREESPSEVTFSTSPQPVFKKNFDLLEQNLEEKLNQGYQIFILSDNPRQLERLKQIFKDRDKALTYEEINHSLHEGFIDHDLKICVYTDHQIFDRYHKFSLRTDKARAARQSLSIKELTRLNPGDYVVHIDHGIGRFGGLITTNTQGHPQEAIKLIYRDNDVILVNIHSLHRISKFKGKEGIPPKINKLGTGAWQKTKDKTKKKVKDIARELIALYAARKSEPGYSFSGDSFLQKELEASFIYEDTPDQYKSTQAIKADMEASTPMDRLVCGDVGFGKTELAIRAAFKAVADNKQVAILVPTTILALQHYHTFRERLNEFPCRIEYISRLKKGARIKNILNDLKEGKVDIIIGTHRLVGKDVFFKDLGLLIIDEEQRFGVSVKDKLKRLKINVDTLTLTATPIPRTLQFSLMGARDLSILNTAPPNRHPIITEVHVFNEAIIKEAILYEVERNGQVFFINNRVQNIYEIEALLNRLLPGIKTIVAHGQMEGPKLEQIMLEFIDGEYDVLISTTIIESGLDIPNANTIIINNAHQFGLSELHQLRGRVGRSNKKAFCYLVAPPFSTLTQEARRRLQIIEEFSELGSGFNIAMQDLDIRGAGNMLGAEQSGYIADIGYETYQRILQEAMLELKEDEFPGLFKEEALATTTSENKKFVQDVLIETDEDVRIPDEYVSNVAERMDLYRELDNIENQQQLDTFGNSMTDRFGQLPPATKSLMEIVKLRMLAQTMGTEKLFLKNKTAHFYFINDSTSPFYQSEQFGTILQWIQQNSSRARMQQRGQKLMLTLKNIKSINRLRETMEEMLNP